MPELPEVETTLNGIKSYVIDQQIINVIIRHPKLRWPIPENLANKLKGQKLNQLVRRGKYLLFLFNKGTVILHLGMSGRLHILKKHTAPQKHDHVDICFSNGVILRFTDPRRFGALLFTENPYSNHPLLAQLGLEPFDSQFDKNYLFAKAKGRKVSIKSFLMNHKIVVGIGNIYATEALFQAGIHPLKKANKLTLAQFKTLVKAIKAVLKQAIKKGGTTLKDFASPSGTPGYFAIELKIYGKSGSPCPKCRHTLKSKLIVQRTTAYCPFCQK